MSISSNGTLSDVWDGRDRVWPSVVYVETTNACNARCLCCLNDKCLKPRGVMSMEVFGELVEWLKKEKLQISAMFCFGEPLLDPTLFDKYALARANRVIRFDHCGLNTNVSKLTPDRYDGILQHTPNITLSFFNVGAEFERITGLSWDLCYGNAVNFIKYRDKHKPRYQIAIGVNTVAGHNLEAVQNAFSGYNVGWARDAEIRWAAPLITGVLDRTIMYPHWRCDGYKGALQVKWDGSCEFCAYDIRGNEDGMGETYIGNFLVDSREELEEKFREKWRSGCSLCLRCDYWHRAKQVLANDCNRPNPLPEDWYDWQLPLVEERSQIRD